MLDAHPRSRERERFILSESNKQWIASLILTLDAGWTVTLSPPRRSPSQNDLFHELCDQIAKARPQWNGLRMTPEDWKQLLILSHAIATKDDTASIRLVPDLEGEGLVQLRESSARMSKARATSLIDYVQSWAAQNGVRFTAEERETA